MSGCSTCSGKVPVKMDGHFKLQLHKEILPRFHRCRCCECLGDLDVKLLLSRVRLRPLCDRVEPPLLFIFVALWVREAVSAVREESLRPLFPVCRLFVFHPHFCGRVPSLSVSVGRVSSAQLRLSGFHQPLGGVLELVLALNPLPLVVSPETSAQECFSSGSRCLAVQC